MFLVALPAAALGHAGLVEIDVPADDRVRLAFEAPVEEAFIEVRVRAAGGAVVSGTPERDPRDPRAVVVPLVAPPGEGATVVWRVLSQDGHAEGGAARLSDGSRVAGRPPAREGNAPLALVARLLMLVGPVALFGLAVLAAWVVVPAVRGGGIVPPGGADDATAFATRVHAGLQPAAAAWWWACAAAGALWLVGAVLQPWALLMSVRSGPGGLGDLLFDTRAGVAWWVQVAGLAVAVGALAGARGRGARGLPPAGATVAAALGAGAALVAMSWAGHASTGTDRAANITIDALHNLATGAWVGGLVGLVAVLPVLAHRLAAGDRLRLSAAVVVRFSTLAVLAVGVLVVTGVYRALTELQGAGDLLHTGYGVALLVKLVLFGGLLGMGAVNRFVYHPRLERAALGLDDGDRGAGARLAQSVRAEVLLALAVLVAVAVMIGLPPPA